MKAKGFRYAMLIGACALLGVAIFYLTTYIGLSIAIRNSGLMLFYQQSIRAMWLGFCLQACLLGILYTIVAFKPHSISRPVIVICGLLPMAEAVLTFSFTGSFVAMLLLSIAALCVLFGSFLWPKAVAAEAAPTATDVV